MPGLFDYTSKLFGSVASAASADTNRVQQQITQTQNKISIFDSEENNYQLGMTDYETLLSSFEGEQENTQVQLTETQQAISNAQTGVSEAQNLLSEAMSIEPKIIKNQDGTETKDTSERDAAIAKAQQALETAQKELEDATQQNIKAQEEADKISQQITELNAKLEELKGNAEITQEKINEAQSELSELENELENLKATDEQGKDNITEINDEEVQRMNELYLEINNVDPDTKISSKDLENAKRKAEIILNSDYDKDNPQVKKYREIAKLLLSEKIDDKPEEGQAYNKTQLKVRSEIREMTTDYLKKQGYTEKTALAVANMYLELGHFEEGYSSQFQGGFEDKDGDTNKGVMIDKYFRDSKAQQGEPWCATFVSWLYGEGQKDPEGKHENTKTFNKDTFGFTNYVPTLEASAINSGYFTPVDDVNNNKYSPVAGDIMIQEEHTGMVVGSDDKYIYTIEGNAGNKVRARKYARDGERYKVITGFVRMNEWTGGKNPPNIFLMDKSKFENADKDKNQSTL